MEETNRVNVTIYEEPGVTWCAPMQNQWHLPALGLKAALEAEGFQVFGEHETVPNPDKDIAIYLDAMLRPEHPPMHKKSIYISLEPPVVNPRFYERITGWPYTKILTFSRQHCVNNRIQWIPFPAVRYETIRETKIDRICAISSNHTHFQGRQGEMYSVRRGIYNALGKQLDLYGRGWERDPVIPHVVNYLGPCDNNFVTFSKYKTALSIENCYLEGYASEKYWTPLQAGCELQRMGWTPDYTLADCDQDAWGKIISGHVVNL